MAFRRKRKIECLLIFRNQSRKLRIIYLLILESFILGKVSLLESFTVLKVSLSSSFQYCWISNTYYIPMEHVIPTDEAPKKEAELGYYQWVPIILLFMSLLFKIPRIIWKVLTFSTAINLDRVKNFAFFSFLSFFFLSCIIRYYDYLSRSTTKPT